ncbi:MAG TPA: PHB depolymerase family esterase [Candidatus Tumulicola sp.]|nr:PHB depolymerase family esterase [Candidatus Tumulicola sp.]
MLTAVAVVAAALVSLAAPAASQAANASDALAPLRAQISRAREVLLAHFKDIQKNSGLAVEIQERLDGDLSALYPEDIPKNWTVDEFMTMARVVATLDASLVDAALTPQGRDWSNVRGAAEVFVTSPADGTKQPVGLYVPATYDGKKPVPLVVLLHGRTQTEEDMLAYPIFRDLAERTGAIILAPFARGDIQYADPAPAEIYRAVEQARSAFAIDPKRVYLSGYSMGGFGVFEVGPAHPEVWAGFLSIAGSMTNADRADVLNRFVGKPVYVVSGQLDDNVPNAYARLTVQWLQDGGIEARYYEQPNGLHHLQSIYPAIVKAWMDMLGGVRGQGTRPAPLAMPVQPVRPD